VDSHARAAVADQRAPVDMKVPDVAKDIETNLIPNAIIVPAMVSEITRFMQKGYSLITVPAFRL
jgi:hypothetical protein